MTNSLAVSAVTTTLQYLLKKGLEKELSSGNVTAMPPDKVEASTTGEGQVNLFLYNISYDAAWRNMTIPNRVKPYESGFPPLPLVLHYIVTAYSKDDKHSDLVSHKLLGQAMSVLHDHPLLGADEIKATFVNQEDLSELSDQVERVRITPAPLSTDEMSKLWATFQTSYRISTTYQVSVVLIESTRAPKAPLPVLTRGEEDSGVQSQTSLDSPYPALYGITPPKKKQPSFEPGDKIVFDGALLSGDTVTALFKHPREKDPIPVDCDILSFSQVETVLPMDEPEKWPAGIYTVSLAVKRAGDQDRVTNEMAFALAPVICKPPDEPPPPPQPLPLVPLDGPLSVLRQARPQGPEHLDATITLLSLPPVRPEQTAFLLLSDEKGSQLTAEPRLDVKDPLVFILRDAPLSGGFYMRLRIDGVDSLLVEDYDAMPPKFDPDQKVIIHD